MKFNLALLFSAIAMSFAASAKADTYTNVCDDPTTDVNGHLCLVLSEHIEHGTSATETLDDDIKWVVFSVAFVAGLGATMYGLHALRRSAFGKTVTR